MALSQISVRIDENLKKQADGVMKELGTHPTQAITWLYQYIAEYHKLPFSIKTIISDKADQTRHLLNQMRHIHEYCQILLVTNQKLKNEKGTMLSMRVADHISDFHRELIFDAGSLSDEHIAVIMSVLERLLNMRDRLIYTVRGSIEGQQTQEELTELSREISIVEQHYVTPK